MKQTCWLIAMIVWCLGGCFAAPDNGGAPREPSAAGQTVQAVVAAHPPGLSPLDIYSWCAANGDGLQNQFGDTSNPCALMCAAQREAGLAVVGAVLSVLADLSSPRGLQLGLCISAMGFDVRTMFNTAQDPWCRAHPMACVYNLISQGICAFQECPNTIFSANRAHAALAAVCSAGPVLAAAYELVGYRNLCVQHLQNEISVPINHQQGCYCDRQEFRSSLGRYHACGATQPSAAIGTAQDNCHDHDSDWLPAASAACAADGASAGSTFYRYTNCRWVRSTDPEWCEFQNYFVSQETNLHTGPENACVCTQREMTRRARLGAEWACSPPTDVLVGTNMGVNQCASNNGDSGWLPAPGPACAAAGRPAGSTWHRKSDCRLITPSSAMWSLFALPAPARPNTITLAAGPHCPAIAPAPPAPAPVPPQNPDPMVNADAGVPPADVVDGDALAHQDPDAGHPHDA